MIPYVAKLIIFCNMMKEDVKNKLSLSHYLAQSRLTMRVIQFFLLSILFATCTTNVPDEETSEKDYVHHIVLFKLQDSTSTKALEGIKAFTKPLADIDVVKDFDFGTNISPEGLDKGYNFSLLMKFETEYDRDSVYLPHPIHREFVDSIGKHITDVIVFDFEGQ